MRTKSATIDLVSDADVNSERRIAEIIRNAFPTHEILGEEENSASADAEDLWVIDPLDGTTNFAHGIPHFAVSIGHYRNGVAQVGVVLNPVTGDLFTASRGAGAFHNGNPISVCDDSELGSVLIGTGFYYDRGAMMKETLEAMERLFRKQIRGIRRMGTASLDLAFVATGQFGGFFEYQLSPWDFAAGKLIVEEAGGRLTTSKGEQLPLATTSVVASNGKLHDSMLAEVARSR